MPQCEKTTQRNGRSSAAPLSVKKTTLTQISSVHSVYSVVHPNFTVARGRDPPVANRTGVARSPLRGRVSPPAGVRVSPNGGFDFPQRGV